LVWSLIFGSRPVLRVVEFDGFVSIGRGAMISKPAHVIERREEFCVGGQVFLPGQDRGKVLG
jgi:hypothetical protein